MIRYCLSIYLYAVTIDPKRSYKHESLSRVGEIFINIILELTQFERVKLRWSCFFSNQQGRGL